MHVRNGRPPRAWDTIKRAFLKEVLDRTGADFSLHRMNGRWATGPRGAVFIVSGEERPEGDRWFMGLDDGVLGQVALGGFLVCETRDGQRIVWGFGRPRWDSLRSGMSRDGSRGELKFDLRKRGDRYFLASMDVTSAQNDMSWLDERGPTESGPPAVAEFAAEALSVQGDAEQTFFARVRGAVLEPLDPTGLSDGDVILVTARPAPVLPSNATLRRIVAAGGPSSLPRDFAEQHDVHGHGAQRS